MLEQGIELQGMLIEGGKSLDELFQGTFLIELYLYEGALDPMVRIREGEEVVGKMTEVERRLYEVGGTKQAQFQMIVAEGILARSKEKMQEIEIRADKIKRQADVLMDLMWTIIRMRLPAEEGGEGGFGVREGFVIVRY